MEGVYCTNRATSAKRHTHAVREDRDESVRAFAGKTGPSRPPMRSLRGMTTNESGLSRNRRPPVWRDEKNRRKPHAVFS